MIYNYISVSITLFVLKLIFTVIIIIKHDEMNWSSNTNKD